MRVFLPRHYWFYHAPPLRGFKASCSGICAVGQGALCPRAAVGAETMLVHNLGLSCCSGGLAPAGLWWGLSPPAARGRMHPIRQETLCLGPLALGHTMGCCQGSRSSCVPAASCLGCPWYRGDAVWNKLFFFSPVESVNI